MRGRIGAVAAAVGLAALIGGMVFFATVMTPLIFAILPPAAALPFIRAAFPAYYGYMIATALIAAAGHLLCNRKRAAGVCAAIALITCALWFGLLPYLETLRRAGQTAGFDLGHEFSVWIDIAQLLAAIGLLGRTAWRGGVTPPSSRP